MNELIEYSALVEGDVLTVAGELDTHGLVAFAADIEEHTGGYTRGLIVDLSGVTLLPSRAISTLVLARRRARRAGVRFEVVVSADSFSRRVLEVCGYPHRTPAQRRSSS